MNSNIKRSSLGWALGIFLGLVCAGAFVYAGGLTKYNSGDTLTAADMNAIVNNINGTGGCPGNPAVPGDAMVRVGSTCVDKYEASIVGNVAQSVAGVLPAVNVTWFDAANACVAAGKRLLTNAEWQAAAAGTVAANCNTSSGTLANTDANPTCASTLGVVNMIGNASEWVADFSPTTSGDISGQSGLTRGGDAGDNATGVYFAFKTPLNGGLALNGFRCGR